MRGQSGDIQPRFHRAGCPISRKDLVNTLSRNGDQRAYRWNSVFVGEALGEGDGRGHRDAKGMVDELQ